MRLFIIIVSLMCFGQTFAQGAFYYNHIQPYSNQPRELVEHKNGYLIAGYNSMGGPQGNGFLMMLDKQGNILWERIEEAPEPDRYEDYRTATYHNGYFYIGGFRWINDQRRNLLLKVNPNNGNILWKKVIGELPVLGGDNFIQDIHPNNDGLLIAASGFDSTSMSTVAELIQTDLEANILWKKIYSADLNALQFSDRMARIEPMESGYLLTMNSRDVPEWQTHHYIIRVDNQGNEIWRKNMRNYESSSTPSDSLYAFQSAAVFQSNHVIALYTIPHETDTSLHVNLFMIEFDENGNEIDHKIYPKKPSIVFSEVFTNEKNEIFVLAHQDLSAPLYYQLYAAKFNAEKEFLWDNHYGEENIAEIYFCGTLTSDGGVLIGGRDQHFHFGTPYFNSILVKTDCEGNTEWNYESCMSPELDEVNIFPNPFSNYVNIHIPNLPEKSEVKIKLYNTVGKLVDNLVYNETDVIQINTNNYAKGLYHCTIEVNGAVIAKKKIVKAE